jgi:hypothetical protein
MWAMLCVATAALAPGPNEQPSTQPIVVSAEKLADDFAHDPKAAKEKYQNGFTVSGKATEEFKRFVRLDPASKVKVWVSLSRFAEKPKKRIGTQLTATGTIIAFRNGELWIDAKTVTPKGP